MCRAKADLNQTDMAGQTAVYLASQAGSRDIGAVLIITDQEILQSGWMTCTMYHTPHHNNI